MLSPLHCCSKYSPGSSTIYRADFPWKKEFWLSKSFPKYFIAKLGKDHKRSCEQSTVVDDSVRHSQARTWSSMIRVNTTGVSSAGYSRTRISQNFRPSSVVGLRKPLTKAERRLSRSQVTTRASQTSNGDSQPSGELNRRVPLACYFVTVSVACITRCSLIPNMNMTGSEVATFKTTRTVSDRKTLLREASVSILSVVSSGVHIHSFLESIIT